MGIALSGQKTVATAGTAVALGTATPFNALMVKALTTNTGLMYVGNNGSGDVDNTNGYPLAAGDQVIFTMVGNLGNIWVDSAVNGEGVAWLILDA